MKNISLFFAAGCFGALISSIFIWGMGHFGISDFLNILAEPRWNAKWLYPRIIWGGLWGQLFFISVKNAKPLLQLFLLSLIPTAAQLFYFFPQSGYGFLGTKLGILMPVFTLAANWIWIMAADFWIKKSA